MQFFQDFKSDISKETIPKKFTFPFYYEPHSLAVIAAKELQDYLKNQKDFNHNFGLQPHTKDLSIGKMFGVLVVKTKDEKLAYLAAFSGKLADNSLPKKFVPPVFNMRTEGSFFLKGEAQIDEINKELHRIKTNDNYLTLKSSLRNLKIEIDDDVKLQKRKLKARKKERKIRKKEGETNLGVISLEKLNQKLEQESYNDQFFFKELREYYNYKLDKISEKLHIFETEISSLEQQRKEKSNYLQQTLFRNYTFLNGKKEAKNLLDIFNEPNIKPPAGSGECAAPKLLNYAFSNDLKPIAMAEFWWGISPSSAVRKHQNFYPACQSRCKPILKHMLDGLEMDKNLLIESLSTKQELPIIYEDDAIIIVNKPAEFLSVPGKDIKDAVYTRIKSKYPAATGPIIVHRLDMSTSGILVLTKTKEANSFIQQQFIKRMVTKRYVALLDGIFPKKKGTIELPLRVDLDDRPKQLVDFKYGKIAKTKWETMEEKNGKTRVYFYPITGRTHQLRVHAAHKDGLNTPILGDDLYGKKADRLHLHAEYIKFIHPSTNQNISFTVPADF